MIRHAALFILTWSIAAQAKMPVLVGLENQLRVVEQSIALTRAKIKENRDVDTLPDLYMTLADFQVQKATLSFSIKRERNPKTPLEDLDSTSEKRMKEDAIETYSLVETRFSTYRDLDKALFFMAHEYADVGQAEKAIQSYKKLTDQFPKSPLWEAAQFAIGNSYFEKKDFAFAIEQFAKILKRGESPYTQLARLRTGWCYINQAKWLTAFDQIEMVYKNPGQVAVAIPPGAPSTWDVREEALVASVWPYLELTSKELAGRMELSDPVTYYRDRSPNDIVYLKVLERLARRLEIKKRHRESARALYLALQLTSEPERKLPILEEFYFLNRDQKLSLWPADYADQIKQTLEAADAPVKKKYESLFRDVATKLHTIGKATKRPEDLEQAVVAYQDYLYIYPKTPRAKEMRVNLAEALFEQKSAVPAAVQYELAVTSLRTDKALINSALQAYMEGLKVPDKLSRIDRLQAQVGFDRLAHKFLRAYPHDPSIPVIEFNLAKLAFDKREFANARTQLRAYLVKYPEREEAESAALLLLDSFYQENDLKNLAQEGQRLLAQPGLKPALKNTVKELVETAKLRRVRNLAGDFGSKQYSENLLKLANGGNSGTLGKIALYEAFLSAKSRKDPQTYAIGETYLARFGNTPEAKSVDLDLIQLALHSADFRSAARYLEGFGGRHPKDPEAANYLTQAESIYQQLQAIEDLKRVTGKTGHREVLAQTLLATRRWTDLGYVASQIPGVAGAYYQGLAFYRAGDKSTATSLLNRAADGAATTPEEALMSTHARFILAQMQFENTKEHLRPQTLSAALIKSAAIEVQGTESSIRHVIDAKQARWVVGSLYLLGQLQLEMASFLVHGQPPKGVAREQLQKALLAQVQRAQHQAKEYFTQCQQVAMEKHVYTHYLAGCLRPEAPFVLESAEFLNPSGGREAMDANLVQLREAVAKRAEDQDAWYRLAEKLFTQHAYADCQLVLSRMMEAAGNQARGWSAMGVVRLHLGDVDGAIQAFQKATALQSGEPLANYALQALQRRYSFPDGRRPAGHRPLGVWTHPWLE